METGDAMKVALANIRKLARDSVVEKYRKSKAGPPPIKAAELPPEIEADEPDVSQELDDSEVDEPESDKETEIIVMAGKKPRSKADNFANMASELPPKRPRGRPKKVK